MKYLHSMLRVADLEASLDFFCNKLGLVELSRKEHELGRFTLVFLAAPGDLEQAKINKAPVIELTYNWDTDEYSEGRHFGHLAYKVDNIYEVCQRLMNVGVEIKRPPRDGYMAFIRSPDNISIELLQAGDPLPVMEPWKSMPNIGRW